MYCGMTVSLCMLEVLAHAGKTPEDRVQITIDIPDDVKILTVPATALPKNWSASEAPDETKNLGSAWAKSRETAVLSVPSAVVPSERNVLLNPKHPDFKKITFSKPGPIPFDPRLKRGEKT